MQILAAASDAHRLRVEKDKSKLQEALLQGTAVQTCFSLRLTTKNKKRLARKDKPFFVLLYCTKKLDTYWKKRYIFSAFSLQFNLHYFTFTVKSPFSTSTTRVSFACKSLAIIVFAMSVSTLLCKYRLSGLAP